MARPTFVAAIAATALLGCAAPAPDVARSAAPAAPAPPSAGAVPLVNPGFESMKPGIADNPEGWLNEQHAGPIAYTFALDRSVARSGSSSLRITNIAPEPYGAVFQRVRATGLQGRTLRYSAWLRTKDVSGNRFGGGGALRLAAMLGGSPAAFDHMRNAEVKGTTEWKRYEVTLAIPRDVEEVEVGALLFGNGTLWLDDAQLEIVDAR